MNRWTVLLLLTMGVASPVAGHHSVNATYDSTRPVTITGTLTKIDWTNPHAWLDLRITNESGQVSTVRVELAGPGSLRQAGIDRDLFQIGQIMKVEAWPPRNTADSKTSAGFAGRTVILDDGRRLDVHDRWGEQFTQ